MSWNINQPTNNTPARAFHCGVIVNKEVLENIPTVYGSQKWAPNVYERFPSLSQA